MELFGNDLGPKKEQKEQSDFFCEKCNYKCFRRFNWDRHLLTTKHCQEINGNKMEIKKSKTSKNEQDHQCENCEKSFQTSSGLWKHKQKCVNNETVNEKAKKITDKDDLIMYLIKENTEYKNMLMEQQNMMMKVLENGTNNVNNNNTINNVHSNNKTFNLQFFLNETCKDAMNIMDFVDSIKLQLSDLEKFGEIDYVEGISKIITSNLKALDVSQRPVHCTDKKRETIYIKDENQWEKADDNKTKLRKAIKSIADKNIRLLPQFRAKYPDYNNSSSRISDKYDKMVIEAMGGSGNNDKEKEDKIIHNISKCTTIDKYMD